MNCTTAMIHNYHMIMSEREGRKAARETSKNTWSHIAFISVGRLHGPLTHLELRKCLDSRSRDNMTLEGRTEGIRCLVNISEQCLECRIHVDAVLDLQSPRTATLKNGGRWCSIWQPPSEIHFLMFRLHSSSKRHLKGNWLVVAAKSRSCDSAAPLVNKLIASVHQPPQPRLVQTISNGILGATMRQFDKLCILGDWVEQSESVQPLGTSTDKDVWQVPMGKNCEKLTIQLHP